MQGIQVWSLGREDPLEKEMATRSGILAWEIPWTEESGGLQSMGSQRIGQYWARTRTHTQRKPIQTRSWCFTCQCEMRTKHLWSIFQPQCRLTPNNKRRAAYMKHKPVWGVVSTSDEDCRIGSKSTSMGAALPPTSHGAQLPGFLLSHT